MITRLIWVFIALVAYSLLFIADVVDYPIRKAKRRWNRSRLRPRMTRVRLRWRHRRQRWQAIWATTRPARRWHKLVAALAEQWFRRHVPTDVDLAPLTRADNPPRWHLTTGHLQFAPIPFIQDLIESRLLVLSRSVFEARARWWVQQYQATLFLRMAVVVLVSAQLFALLSMTMAGPTPEDLGLRVAGVVCTAAAGLYPLMLRLFAVHDLRQPGLPGNLAHAMTVLGSPGLLPAVVFRCKDAPVIHPMFDRDSDLEFGVITGYQRWLDEHHLDAAELETMRALATEFEGSSAELVAAAVALNQA